MGLNLGYHPKRYDTKGSWGKQTTSKTHPYEGIPEDWLQYYSGPQRHSIDSIYPDDIFGGAIIVVGFQQSVLVGFIPFCMSHTTGPPCFF